jgi:ketosteroid isomerase-like protein
VGTVRAALAPDVVWRIPGHHPLSGPKHGVDEVLAFFDQLARADMKAEPYAQAVTDDYVLDFHRGWSEAGAKMDTTWCLAFRFVDGRIQEVTNLCADQHVADQFFWSVYALKPIPDRLAARS